MRFLKSFVVVVCVAALGACATSSAVEGTIELDAGTTGTDSGLPGPTKDSGGGGTDSAVVADDAALPAAPAPVAVSIAPANAAVGALGPTLIVTGTDFVARSLVRVDGDPLSTTFVSATELRAALPTSKLATAGILNISVATSAPGGGMSADVPFEVQNPIPVLTTLSPSSAVADSPATSLTLTGTTFAVGVKV
ncbi:MAG: IPT/TIG domain-containing protein, partial [Polyangiaceae bacterium]